MVNNSSGVKTRQQIAKEYGVCTKTLNKWLKEEKIIIKRGLIRPKHQELIYRKIGLPKYS
jgi:phage antirepressor YoqD-like protein